MWLTFKVLCVLVTMNRSVRKAVGYTQSDHCGCGKAKSLSSVRLAGVPLPECVIGEQQLGEWSAKFAMPGCDTGGPVRWSVAGAGKAAISHFHSLNRCSPLTLSGRCCSCRAAAA